MSLYGSGRRYTMGAVRNAQLAPVTYPGWTLRFYCEPPTPHTRFGAVPSRLSMSTLDIAVVITRRPGVTTLVVYQVVGYYVTEECASCGIL